MIDEFLWQSVYFQDGSAAYDRLHQALDDAYGGDAVELSTPLGLGGMHTAAWEPRLPVASHRRNLTHAASQPIVNI